MTLIEQITFAENLAGRLGADNAYGVTRILGTLRWLAQWETVVRDAVARRKTEIDALRAAHPALDAVLEAFPDAVVEVHPAGGWLADREAPGIKEEGLI